MVFLQQLNGLLETLGHAIHFGHEPETIDYSAFQRIRDRRSSTHRSSSPTTFLLQHIPDVCG